MARSGTDEVGPGMLQPQEIAEQYELHSQRSTAVNDVLIRLRLAPCGCKPPPEWEEALRVNRLSMWLHQVLAFEHVSVGIGN